MIDRRIGKIKVRRGTDSQRVTNTFEEGEVIYSVDKKRIFVGDDVTLGGVPVCNRNYIVESLGFPPVLPDEVLAGDIIHDKSNSKTYIVHSNGGILELLLISDKTSSNNPKQQITDIYTKLITLTGCLTPVTPPPPPPSKLTWAIQPSNFSINIGDTATFSSSAVGFGDITYEWRRKDGLTINTSNIYQKSFTINNAGIPDIATYYCIASNSIDSITSREAVLDIGSNSILAEDGTYILSELSEFIDWESNVVAPIITKQPVSISTTEGTSVTFSIEAIGTDPLTYQWKLAGADIAGETKTTYTITNTTVGINSIACKVSNIGGEVLSDSVNLSIVKEALLNSYVGVGGSYHTIFLGINGEAWGAGENTHGQLGLGDNLSRNIPTRINIPPVKITEGGNGHTLFLGMNGNVSACGLNDNGQLGLGDTISRNEPVKINISNVKAIAAGSSFDDTMNSFSSFSLFLGEDGTVSACGANHYGQLGLGDTDVRTVPTKLDLTNVDKIFAGAYVSYFIGIDESLSACGINDYGQLGNRNKVTQKTPVKIEFPPLEMVSPGLKNCLFMGTDGSVSACGFNRWGELIGSADKPEPVKLDLPPVRKVGLRWDSAFFLGIDNTLSACGDNSVGQFGNNTITYLQNNNTPILIDLPPIKTFSIGFDSTFYIGFDNSVSACGYNGTGQLGLGDNANKSYPITITR